MWTTPSLDKAEILQDTRSCVVPRSSDESNDAESSRRAPKKFFYVYVENLSILGTSRVNVDEDLRMAVQTLKSRGLDTHEEIVHSDTAIALGAQHVGECGSSAFVRSHFDDFWSMVSGVESACRASAAVCQVTQARVQGLEGIVPRCVSAASFAPDALHNSRCNKHNFGYVLHVDFHGTCHRRHTNFMHDTFFMDDLHIFFGTDAQRQPVLRGFFFRGNFLTVYTIQYGTSVVSRTWR